MHFEDPDTPSGKADVLTNRHIRDTGAVDSDCVGIVENSAGWVAAVDRANLVERRAARDRRVETVKAILGVDRVDMSRPLGARLVEARISRHSAAAFRRARRATVVRCSTAATSHPGVGPGFAATAGPAQCDGECRRCDWSDRKHHQYGH